MLIPKARYIKPAWTYHCNMSDENCYAALDAYWSIRGSIRYAYDCFQRAVKEGIVFG